jgi:hypothetical protein
MYRSFKQDYAFGKANEEKVINLIKPHFEDSIESSDNPFSINDFKGSEYHYELKSRTNAYKDYDTTLLPCNKVFCDKHIFLFLYTDGLYYIVYDKKVFDTFEKKPFKRRLRVDYKDKEALYYYIPIDKLTHLPIDKLSSCITV